MVPKGKLLRKLIEKYFKRRYTEGPQQFKLLSLFPSVLLLTVLEWKLQMSANDKQWNLSVFSY